MASWVLSQQGILSLAIILLMLNHRISSQYLGARLSYFLWLVVPVIVLINSIEQTAMPIQSTEVTRYLVELKDKGHDAGQLLSWQVIWIIGTVCVILFGLKSSWQQGTPSNLLPLNTDSIEPNIPSNLSVYTSKQINSPMLVGVFRVKLILPQHFLHEYSASQQRLIIAHELCHFKRRDNLANLCAMICLSVCWFNPLAWLGYRSFRQSQEQACDSAVLANKSVEQRIEYSKALLHCAVDLQPNLSIYSNYNQGNTMFNRIKMLKDHELCNPFAQGTAVLVVALLMLMATTVVASPVPHVDKSETIYPKVRIEPRYPIQAAKDKVEGSVLLKFDITPTGAVDRVSVIKAEPKGVFDKEAMKALKLWKYQRSEQGAVNQMVQLDFVMDNSTTNIKNLMSNLEQIKVKH